MTRHIQLRAGKAPAIDDSPNWSNLVRKVYRDNARELRFAAWKFKRMGFRITRVTLDRLAYRLAFNESRLEGCGDARSGLSDRPGA